MSLNTNRRFRDLRELKDLNLCDDFLFKEVMKDKKIVVGFLEMVLDLKDKIKEVKFIEAEKTIDSGYDGKTVRLDVYVMDEKDTVYNIEIQNGKFKNIGKRCRKYQENIDNDFLKRGHSYDRLKKQYIIMICTGDPFGEGFYKYTFSNRCHEKLDLELGDECEKIFLNTKGKTGEVSRELKAFLNFVEKSTVENALDIKDSYVKRLSTRIEAIKKDEELGGRFMTLEERMDEIREDGLEEGIKQGIEQGIKQGIEQGIKHGSLQIAKEMKEEGFSIEQIVKLTKLSKEEIESL